MAAQTEELEEDVLAPPPPSFQRMLSWQLSQVVDYTADNKKTKKKKRKKSRNEDNLPSPATTPLSDTTDTPSFTDQQSDNGYTVTNSDGEDEVYYSAPETPYTSSDSDEDDMATTTSSVSSLPTATESLDSYLTDYHKTKGRLVYMYSNYSVLVACCIITVSRLHVHMHTPLTYMSGINPLQTNLFVSR